MLVKSFKEWLLTEGKVWDKESVFAEASKYKSRYEFQKGCLSAYNKAYKNGWLDEIPWEKSVKHWSDEDLFKEAQKYKTKTEFAKNSKSAYALALRRGLMKDMDWFEEKCKPNGYWQNKENVFAEAEKYKTKLDFEKGCGAAYNSALKHGWLDEMDWLVNQIHPNGYWTKDRVFDEARKYTRKVDFKYKASRAYILARKNGWLQEMDWFINYDGDHRPRFVYAYTDEENKVAYVGITVNKEMRHKSHYTGEWMNNQNPHTMSPVYKYFTGIGKEVPEPIYLEEDLPIEDAQEKEDYWRHYYEDQGYTMLNSGKTGRGIGSIGHSFKWSKENIFAEGSKYKTTGEFSTNNYYAFSIAKKKGWLKEMDWLKDTSRKKKSED